MLRSMLLRKVIGIISVTLFAGFTAMGLLTLWLEYQATMELQINNSRNLASIVTKNISDAMMKGESNEINAYVKDMKVKQFVSDLKVFTVDGVDTISRNSEKNQDIIRTMSAGTPMERVLTINGTHLLSSAIPLHNEERCKQCHDATPRFLGVILLNTSLETGYASAKRLTLLLTAAGGGFFLVMICSLILFFKKSIVNRILDCSETVQRLAQGEGDLTTELPVRGDDEIGQLSSGINKLTGKLREIISDLYWQTEYTAVAICKVDQETARTVSAAADQKEQSTSVAVAAEEMAATLNEVAANTQRAAQLSSQVDSAAGEGMSAVGETFTCIEVISGSVVDTLNTVERLAASSNTIGEITTLIEDIADQTNLLALNAAIEAARAGEHGRGFAVVADEVKSLSAKTAKSTKEIARIIKNIQKESTSATSSMILVKARVEEGVAKSIAARNSLENILRLAGDATEMINQIACATEEQSTTTEDISMRIHQISESASVVHSQMQANGAMFRKLAEVAEQVFSTVGKFRVGNHHDSMKGYADELRTVTLTLLEKALSDGKLTMEVLFDRRYVPIPKTSPQKFTTSFDNFFDTAVSPLQEQILAKDSRMFFAICIDDHGYVPSHNRRYSKPLTGNQEVDKINNRTKRIFDDRTGLRAAGNRDGDLLQTYIRDTGEIMNDISMPIVIRGRHWGAVRIGYQCEARQQITSRPVPAPAG